MRRQLASLRGRLRGDVTVAEESDTYDRIWRAVDEHRADALQQLDAVASNAMGDLFSSRRRDSSSDPDHKLARMLARDLTALGIVVHASSKSVPTGGVWLGPCIDHPGVIVTWTQHAASAAVLGSARHRDLQETMNFDLSEVLRTLGYTVKAYGGGGAHLVTASRR